MRIRTVVATIVGSLTCYVVVACTSDVIRHGDGEPDDDAAVADTHVAVDSRVVADAVDAIADVLGVDLAVPEAEAGPLPDDVADVVCVPVDGDGGAGGAWWARKSFPGRTRIDLSRGRAIVCYPGTIDGLCSTTGLAVADGQVGAYCGITANHATSATIVMPAP